MLRRLKSFIYKNEEAQEETDRLGEGSLDNSIYKPERIAAAMVETRSGRHVSPIASTPNTSSKRKSTSRRASPSGDIPSAPKSQEPVEKKAESENISSKTEQGTIQALPDRSKGSPQQEETSQPSLEVVTETQLIGVGSVVPDVTENGQEYLDLFAESVPESTIVDEIDATFVTATESPVKITTEQTETAAIPASNEVETSHKELDEEVVVQDSAAHAPSSPAKNILEQPETPGNEAISTTSAKASHSPSEDKEVQDPTTQDIVLETQEQPTTAEHGVEAPTRHGVKTIHKRFEDEELQAPTAMTVTQENAESVPTLGNEDQNNEGEDESDDDAPEEVTTSAGAQQARSATMREAQSIQNQQEAERAKRRQRDEDRRLQNEASRKRKAPVSSQPTNTSVSDSILASTLLGDDDLPDELPEEILAREPIRSLDTNISTAAPLNKRKRLDQDSKPAKDLQVGNTNVRVLPQTNLSLPPPSVKQAMNVKEAWLKSRAVESRKKMAGYRTKGAGARSFLRR